MKYIKKKVKKEKVVFYCQLAHTFEITELAITTVAYIHRCFTMVAETPEFVELNFDIISKILSSSQLEVTSEMEVFNAVDCWISHCFEQRSQFTMCLLKRVRLPLLSDYALEHILQNSSSFSKSSECVKFLKGVMDNRELAFKDKSSASYQTRYCEQKYFNFLVLGGKIWQGRRTVGGDKSVRLIDGCNFTKISDLSPNIESHKHCNAVFIKGEVFLFGGYGNDFERIMSIEKYSNDNKIWKVVGYLPNQCVDFCVCSFMGNAYVLGGFVPRRFPRPVPTCFKFKAADCSMNEIAEMETAKRYSACAVFEGNIVVSGGSNFGRRLNTVEAYDHVANEWTSMPHMIKERSGHKSVAIKNKLYVFGGFTKTSEVYDSTCKKFVLLKSPDDRFTRHLDFPRAVLSIGKKLVVIQKRTNSSLIYDEENDTWSEESFEVSRNLSAFSIAKVPQY